MGKLIKISIIVIIFLNIILAIFAYYQSSQIKKDGDLLIDKGNLEEALLSYQKAYEIFPLTLNIKDDISATKLRISSKNEYNQIVDTEYAEVQALPSINSLPSIEPKEGELIVPILMYHHIRINPKPEDAIWASLNVSQELLDNELIYLKNNGYHTITLDDLNNALTNQTSLPSRPIVLTFDDGYSDFYDNAYPLLKRYNMKAIEFVITNVETAPAYLSWEKIIEMDKSGVVEFGAHTQDHPDLTVLSSMIAHDEIFQSKSELEKHLDKKVVWFAYPYGSYNNRIIDEVKSAGFKGAVSTNYSLIQNKDKLFVMPRIQADGRFTLDEFAKRIQNK